MVAFVMTLTLFLRRKNTMQTFLKKDPKIVKVKLLMME
jgi:hypothetical protein